MYTEKQQQHRGHCEAVQDDEDKKAEIYNHVTGDFLTEAREQAESTHGPHKPLTDRYKGMTTDELKVFRNAQLQQMEEIHVSMSGGITIIRGPHKPLTDRYKGMTTNELKVFRNAQLQQMEEIHSWDLLMDSHLQTAYSYDRKLNIKKSEVNKKIAEKNLWLAEQQKQHQEYLNRFVYKHQPTPDFYEQFNKGTR
ncbi:PREDICTED: RIB43A-like with coiled-coils protein 2 [Trachymyrmex cornetzi]|uniref:RIB43A-like with coiled-coils protein 2 n=1 Tax=Trachymyrmex cornetzi TaxID=471704 RepID=UPI00084F1566|nr:PREDICTED: RIB43A-like with coiled-coils protein 2 [Trachymyrmex cornetzi]